MAKTLFSVGFILLLLSCSSKNSQLLQIVDVKGHNTDSIVAGFCSDFRLTKEQAMYYFLNAIIASITTINSEYDVLPCFVYGTAKSDDKI